MTPVNRSMSPREWSLLLALSLLWGGSFFFNGVAVRDLPPVTVVLLRVGLAAVILNAVLAVLGQRLPREPRVWRALFGMALLNNALPFTLIVWGQKEIASGLAAILNATTPLFTALLAHAFTQDEKLSAGQLTGVVVGFFGVVVMIGPAAVGGVQLAVLAQLACLAAARLYAIAGVYGRRFQALGVSPMMTATGQVTASTVLLLPMVAFVDRPWTLAPPGPAAIGAVVGIAVLSTALAYILYFRILATAGATNLLLVTFLIPANAILLGTFALGEQLLPQHVAGMVLIGAGLAAIDGRLVAGFHKRGALPSSRSD